MTAIRVALATGSIHLPQKHFVLDHALHLQDRTSTELFTYSALGMNDVPDIPVHVFAPRVRLPYNTRRRLYPVGSRSMSRAIVNWHPHIVHLHFMALGAFAARSSKAASVPLVTTVHALEPHLLKTSRTRRDRYLRDQCLDVLDATTLFLPVSRYIEGWLLDLGVSQDRIAVNYLGIDTDYWKPWSDTHAASEKPRILFVGNLTELKGVRDLVHASAEVFAELPHELDVIGDGPLRQEIEEFSSQHRHIKVHGRLPREGVRLAMNEARFLVLPTQTHQGISDAAPFVLMEAQSMGVPAVTFDVGGTAELIANPDLLVPEGDQEALRSGMTALLSLGDAEYRMMSDHSRAWVVENRSRAGGAKATLEHYRRLIVQGP